MSLDFRILLQQIKNKGGGGLPNKGNSLPYSNPYGQATQVPVRKVSFKRETSTTQEKNQMENKVEIKEDKQDDSAPPLPNEKHLQQTSDLNKKNPPKKPLPDIKILKQDGGLTSNEKTKKLRKTLKTKMSIKNETIEDLEQQIQNEEKSIVDSETTNNSAYDAFVVSKLEVEYKDNKQRDLEIAKQPQAIRDEINARRNDLTNKHKLFRDNANNNISQLRNRLGDLKATKTTTPAKPLKTTTPKTPSQPTEKKSENPSPKTTNFKTKQHCLLLLLLHDVL